MTLNRVIEVQKKGTLNIGLFSKIFTIVDLRGKNRSFLFCLLVLFCFLLRILALLRLKLFVLYAVF